MTESSILDRKLSIAASALRYGVCDACGCGLKMWPAGPGQTVRYRNLGKVPLPPQVAVPTCPRCLVRWIDADTASTLEPLLRPVYEAALRQRARESIDVLMQHKSQRQIERLLGLSQGYLSRLRAGASTPSAELVSHLALLAREPATRLAELEGYWGVAA